MFLIDGPIRTDSWLTCPGATTGAPRNRGSFETTLVAFDEGHDHARLTRMAARLREGSYTQTNQK